MKNLLEKAIYAELNKDPMADTLLRQFVISRCAQINEALRKGKEFVLEDLDGPSIPDVSITEDELLIDTPGADEDGDSDDGDFVLDDGFNVDADNSGDVSDDEAEAAMEHLRAAIDELEAMFAEDDDEDTEEGDDVEAEEVKPSVAESRRARKVRESTIVTRKPDATITVEFEDDDSTDATVTAEPVVDAGEDEGTVVSTDASDDTDGLGMDDDEDGTVIPTVEARRAAARARVIEGRKARAAKVTAKKK
jgi:hypothetical protein